MEQNINHIAHNIIKNHIHRDAICLDATCGNGYDTLFLTTHGKHVYAMDIQQAAIDASTRRLQQASRDNVTFIHGSHDQIVSLYPEDIIFDIVVYNLGYLPHGNHHIITQADSTVSSLRQVIPRLRSNGLIVLTIYTGHDGGQEEADAIVQYVSSLDKHAFTIQRIAFINRINSPFIIALQKL